MLIPSLIGGYLICTSTITFFPSLSPWDIKRIGELLLFAVALPAALFIPSLRKAFTLTFSQIPRFFGVGLSVFLALGITSSFLNAESMRGLQYSLVDVSVFALLFSLLIVVSACRELSMEHFDRLVAALLLLLGLGVGVQELSGFWASRIAGYSYSFDIALLNFSHPRMYNHLQTWTIPVVAAVPYIFLQNRLALVLSVLTLGLHWYVLLVTGARGSVVSLLVAFSVLTILSRLFRRTLLKIQLAGILLGTAVFFISLTWAEMGRDNSVDRADPPTQKAEQANSTDAASPPTSTPTGNRSSDLYDLSIGRPMLHTTGRSRLWRSAMGHAASNPLLGIGPMNFACKGPTGRVGSPHNLVFQIISEWGIPAAIILGALTLALLVNLAKQLPAVSGEGSYVPILRVSLVLAVLAAAIHLMVSSLLIAPASQVAAALIGGWLFALRRQDDGRVLYKISAGWLAVTATCSLALLAFAHRESSSMSSYREQLPKIEQGRPRFWQLGKACSPRLITEGEDPWF